MDYNQQIRYSRHLSLSEIGPEGQKKLLSSKVLVIGAGGLGSPLLLYLAAAGIGHIGIVDDDRVELSNLQRQILHETGDIFLYKVDSAREALHDLNPEIEISCYQQRITKDNIHNIADEYDIVADGSDNFDTRLAVSDYCHNAGKTLVSAAIQGFSGQLSVYKSYLGAPHPCYRCLTPEVPPTGSAAKCSESGILGSIAGIMGSWQATEVIKELLEIGSSLSGYLLIFEALTSSVRKVRLSKDSNCKCCIKTKL